MDSILYYFLFKIGITGFFLGFYFSTFQMKVLKANPPIGGKSISFFISVHLCTSVSHWCFKLPGLPAY
jgi:uncharacterized protein YneF (UPF0154 family)